jgi:hypothetical protein
MTPPTDTAAALWSAIDAYGCDAALHGALGRDATTREALDRAITAHVEAEVARRLAPNLELWRWKCHDETIEKAIERLVRERNEYAEKLCERNVALVMAPDVEAAIAKYGVQAAGGADTTAAETALRAAFAADKARAVEAGSRVDVRLLRDALRYVTAWGCVPGGSEEWKARNQDRVEDELRAAIKRGLDGGDAQARPTPDEARRLVEEAIGAGMALACHGDWSDEQRAVDRAHADSARTALLRALGVEA